VRALFVTNQRKTEFYSPWARGLEQSGVEVFWISVGARWTDYLVQEGWDRARILDLSDWGRDWTRPYQATIEEKARIDRIDALAEIGLKDALIMDRELSLNNGWDIEAYAQVVALRIEDFVLQHDIRFAFGEDTWAPEIITSAVMHANGRHFHAPHTIRVPSERIAFFRGVFQKSVEVVEQHPGDADRAIARQAIHDLRERGERPYYFALNARPNRLRKHWFAELYHAVAQPPRMRFDHTIPTARRRTARRLKSIAFGRLANALGAFEAPPASPGRPFALLLLHKQPESSVDVIGAPFTNQFEVIKALVRLLPFGWELWIKEHSNAIGDRSPAFYRNLRRLPGVRLIDYNADTLNIFARAGLVASISGTACLEAGLLGVPAITFAKMYFGDVLLRNGLDPFALDHREMAGILAEAEVARRQPRAEQAAEDYLTWTVAQSFPGLISDPVSLPSVTSSENVRNVADATMKLMRHLAG
jgi:hypothetical protein